MEPEEEEQSQSEDKSNTLQDEKGDSGPTLVHRLGQAIIPMYWITLLIWLWGGSIGPPNPYKPYMYTYHTYSFEESYGSSGSTL